jgi:hypothetical protein
MDAAPGKESVGTAPFQIRREQAESARRSEPEHRRPRDGHPEDGKDRVTQDDVVRRREGGSVETNGEWGAQARAELERPFSVELYAHANALQRERVTLEMKGRLVDVHVPARVESLRPGVETHLVRPERHWKRSRKVGSLRVGRHAAED